MKLLVIDDAEEVIEAVTVSFNVQWRETEILGAANGEAGLDLIEQEQPDLVLLDVMMPVMDGYETLRRIRAFSDVPVIMLTAKDGVLDKVKGLELGADDYITKPFSTVEFRARIRAQLRRSRTPAPQEEDRIEVDGLTIQPARRIVARNAVPIHLTPTEWDLLRAFILHRGRTLTHSQLFRAVWNRSSGDPQQYLRVHVANLRRKIELDSLRPRLIVTEPGVGYRFETLP